jgi:hypothetical protein
MKAAYKLACLVVLLCSVCISVSAQDKGNVNPKEKVRLVALCKNDVADSYRAGVDSALSKTGMKDSVEVEHRVYYNERQGLEWLIESIEADTVDIVLGPTDSGIFTRALERREELEAHTTLVVSPLVTAAAENQPDGWFFLTNVDVCRRVEAIHDYLNKCLIRSIAILYADTEFGRRAEETLKNELRENQRKNYQPIPFKSLAEARFGLREVLDRRPEAVGIFGSNEDIKRIYNYLQCMNHAGISYKPFLFTIMDARKSADDVDDLFFVSVAKCDSPFTVKTAEKGDEVQCLAYDTGVLLLNELKNMPPGPFDRQHFRDRFSALLRGPLEEPGPKTQMTFNKHRNSSPPRVFHLLDGDVYPVKLAQVVHWPQKLSIKWELIKRRYGFWPMVNLVLLALVVVGVSVSDLSRWYGKGVGRALRGFYFYLFLGVNIALVFALYFFLAETGRIRYDSVITTLIIAFTPSVLLRATFFETPTGKAIGLAKLYDRFLLWINDKLMMSKYRSQAGILNLIAYRNSVFDMKNQLLQIYQHARNKSQGKRLQAELKEELEKAESLLERRYVCARHLLGRLDLEELKGKGFVPDNFDPKKTKDPQKIIRESVRYCVGNPDKEKTVNELIVNRLAEARGNCPTWAEKAEKEYNDELESTGSAQGKLHVRVRFLYVQLGYGEDDLRGAFLLPPKKDLTEPLSLWQKLTRFLRSLLRQKKSADLPQTKNQEQPPEG